MKFIVQALIGLAASAAPQSPMNTPFTGSISGPIVQASSPILARHIAVWEDNQMRLELVGEELDAILADVIEIESEDARALDPLLVELFVRKADLEELVLISVEGFRQGAIRNASDLASLHDTLDSEIHDLEQAVQAFRAALDEYLTGVIEV